MPQQLILSPLAHTWLIDLDGTVLKHNGHLTPQGDCALPKSLEFIRNLPAQDAVIFLTSRPRSTAAATEAFLAANGLRFSAILYDLPYGERVLINDKKPSGLVTALSVNLERDAGIDAELQIDAKL